MILKNKKYTSLDAHVKLAPMAWERGRGRKLVIQRDVIVADRDQLMENYLVLDHDEVNDVEAMED